MKVALTARTLRIALTACMLLLIAGAVSGFIFARNQLQSFATSISQMEADSASVDNNIDALKQLQVSLKGLDDIKAKADAVTVPSADYPVAVIANITKIATQSGVKLTSINYGDASSTGVAPATPNAPAAGTATTPTTPVEPTTPAGVTKKAVNVTIESPVNYDKLMNFIQGIETDNMYMHITKVSLSKGDGNAVTVQPFTIEVYTK